MDDDAESKPRRRRIRDASYHPSFTRGVAIAPLSLSSSTMLMRNNHHYHPMFNDTSRTLDGSQAPNDDHGISKIEHQTIDRSI
jgi:hypothetical protein